MSELHANCNDHRKVNFRDISVYWLNNTKHVIQHNKKSIQYIYGQTFEFTWSANGLIGGLHSFWSGEMIFELYHRIREL